MPNKALVLGGGGTLGIAWMTGLAAGLLEGGVSLLEADTIVGTSAGSVVGTYLAAGFDPRLVLEFMKNMVGAAPTGATELDRETVGVVFAKLANAGQDTVELRRELGALALAARTGPEESYVAMMAQLVGIQEWPEKRLLITAVDANTGEFLAWEKGGAADIGLAVASSCCVPGFFPPVSIGSSRYVDGGMRTGTNADLAAGHDRVLIVAPLGDARFGPVTAQISRETATLQSGGSQVELVLPDEGALEAFGIDLMDASRVLPAAEAGIRQGVALAERLRGFWS